MGTKLFLKNSSNQVLKNSSGKFIYKMLPPEYQEVEYIGAGSGQYIATNLNFNHTSSLEIFGKSYIASSGERACVASEYSDGSRLSIEVVSSGFRVYNNANPDFTNNGLTFNAISEYSIRYNRSAQTITSVCNNVTVSRSGATYGNSGVSFYLFVDRVLRFSTFNKAHKLYYFRIIKDGKDYCYLVPCIRTLDGKPGLYDLVNNNFYTNVGTGEFTIGPCKDLPSDYQWVNYITFSGTSSAGQFIRTGITSLTHPFSVRTLYNKTNTEIRDQTLVGQRQLGKYVNIYNTYYETLYGSSNTNTAPDNAITSIEVKSGVGVIKNGTTNLFPTANTNNQSSSYELLIGAFSENDYTGAKWFLSGHIYSIKIINAGEIFRDFIPCYRKSDSVIGLYDIVNQQFYTNAGTGTFTKGSDIG